MEVDLLWEGLDWWEDVVVVLAGEGCGVACFLGGIVGERSGENRRAQVKVRSTCCEVLNGISCYMNSRCCLKRKVAPRPLNLRLPSQGECHLLPVSPTTPAACTSLA